MLSEYEYARVGNNELSQNAFGSCFILSAPSPSHLLNKTIRRAWLPFDFHEPAYVALSALYCIEESSDV